MKYESGGKEYYFLSFTHVSGGEGTKEGGHVS